MLLGVLIPVVTHTVFYFSVCVCVCVCVCVVVERFFFLHLDNYNTLDTLAMVRSGQVRSGQVRSGQVRVFKVHIQSKLL